MSTCICIVLYRLENLFQFFSLLTACAEHNIAVVIVCNNERIFENKELLQFIETNNVELVVRRNKGWDWGAYVHFANLYKDRLKHWNRVLFMHDDLEIHVEGLFRILNSKDLCDYDVIGNLVGGTMDIGSPRYLHETRNYVNSEYVNMKVSLFRGSFLILKAEYLVLLSSVRVYDFGPIIFANRSLREFAIKLHMAKKNLKFKYLSSDDRFKKEIKEYYRGSRFSFEKVVARVIRRTVDFLLTWNSVLCQYGLRDYNFRKDSRLRVNLTRDIPNINFINVCLDPVTQYDESLEWLIDQLRNEMVGCLLLDDCALPDFRDLIHECVDMQVYVRSSRSNVKSGVRVLLPFWSIMSSNVFRLSRL